MTLKQLQDAVDQWIHKYGVRYFDEMTNLALLMEEMGEFARIIARVYGEQSFKGNITPGDTRDTLADEMADILFVLTCLANQMQIDLESAVAKNLQKKSLRDKDRHGQNPKLR